MDRDSQSLSGRTGILHLLPFERAELEEKLHAVPDNPGTLFTNKNSAFDLWDTIHSGYYPRIHTSAIPPEVWLPDYIRTYIEWDVLSLVNIGDLERFDRFLALTADRTGQILNYSSLANDCGIALDTAKRWVSVLKTGFIIFLLPPHHRNFNKRLIKSPKLYFYDTGLACSLLGIRSAEQAHSNPLRGALFENLIIAEAAKAYTHHRTNPPMYYWRDRTEHEIDLLLNTGGKLHPVEIKSGQTVASNMFDSLTWWSTQADSSLSAATLVYGGTDFQTRNQISVRPWFSI